MSPQVAGSVSAEKTEGTAEAPQVPGSTPTESVPVAKSEQSNIVAPSQSSAMGSNDHLEVGNLENNSREISTFGISQRYKDTTELRLKESQTQQALADAITKKLSFAVAAASFIFSVAMFVMNVMIQRQPDMANKSIDKLVADTDKQKHDLRVSQQQQRSKIHIEIIPSVIMLSDGRSVGKTEKRLKKYVKIEGRIQNDGLLDAILDIGSAKCFIGKIIDTTTDVDDNGHALVKVDAARPIDWGKMLDGTPITKLGLFSGEKDNFVGIHEVRESGVYLITVSIPYCNPIIETNPDRMTEIDSIDCSGAVSKIGLSSRTVGRAIVVVD